MRLIVAMAILAPSTGETAELDGAERQRVIDGVISNLKDHYVSPEVARRMAEALAGHEKVGDYTSITAGAAFAALLTRQLRDVSHDMHLEVV
jgi:hypothetical protein